MTGRDLIIYILQNGLENEQVIKDGKILGFLTISEAAEKMNVGTATIYTLVTREELPYAILGEKIYIPANFEPPNGITV